MRKIFPVLFILLFFTSFGIGYAGEIVVEKITKAELTKIIKERKGKVLFLNLWATWCVPCREEFPSIVKLAGEFKDVEFIGISVDFPEEVKSKIIPFLIWQNANFISYVNAFESDEELINLLDKDWNGALPATFIYDKTGKKISFLEGKKSYEDFKKEIDKARKK